MAQVGNAAHAAKQATGLGLDAKEAQMLNHTTDVHSKGATSTTDYGLKVSNQDDWLTAGNENSPGKSPSYHEPIPEPPLQWTQRPSGAPPRSSVAL